MGCFMKHAGLLGLLVIGLLLGWIGWRAKEPSWTAPPKEEIPQSVPVALSGEVPEGCVVRRFEVEGMCCKGCPGKLYAHLANVAGVREIAVDPILERAEAVVPADMDVASLEAALTFGQYSARAEE